MVAFGPALFPLTGDMLDTGMLESRLLYFLSGLGPMSCMRDLGAKRKLRVFSHPSEQGKGIMLKRWGGILSEDFTKDVGTALFGGSIMTCSPLLCHALLSGK